MPCGETASLSPFFIACSASYIGAPDERRTAERVLDDVEHLLVARVQAQRREVVGHAADRRSVGTAVVVDDDHQWVLGRGDVVQRLPAHPAGQRTVADDDGDMPILTAKREPFGHAVGVRQRGRRVRVLDHVVLGLGLVRISGQAAALAEQVEAGLPTGDDLVDVRLMPGIEQDAVFRGIEHPMQGEREFDHAEIRTEVSAGARHLGHEEIADLRGQDSEFRCGQLAQVTRAVDAGQEAGRVG